MRDVWTVGFEVGLNVLFVSVHAEHLKLYTPTVGEETYFSVLAGLMQRPGLDRKKFVAFLNASARALQEIRTKIGKPGYDERKIVAELSNALKRAQRESLR